jgi:hypothetical protein
LRDPSSGAQRASSGTIRLIASIALAATVMSVAAVSASAAAATTSALVRPKVVVIVGPVGSSTSEYISDAKRLATQARGYGAIVTELYSPNATWSRVLAATKGANVVIYLGHGNGSPSPYPTSQASQNGLGLNASASGSNTNVRYYGETYIAKDIRLAPNAVVILNHLCYASGNNEWGKGNPTQSVAMQRVDNYGQGFLRAGAAAVFAEGITDPGYILANLFRTSRTMADIFWAAPTATSTYKIAFNSKGVSGAEALMDPYAANRYYRSVIGRLTVTAADWR